MYSVNNVKLNYYGAELTSLLAFSNIPHCRGCFQPASLRNLLYSHITRLYNNSVSHLNGLRDLRCLSLINRGRSTALYGRLISLCFDVWLADASGRADSRFWGICLIRFHMCCNYKQHQISGRSPSFWRSAHYSNWNVPVFPMAVGVCGPPRPLGRMHSVTLFLPLATPLVVTTSVQQYNLNKPT